MPDVDDVAQDVFVQAWKNLGTYQSTGSLRAWLLGIARHRALDFLRRETVRRQRRDLLFEFAEADLVAVGVDAQSEDVESDQVMRQLQACLEQLEARQQSLIRRFYFEDESAESIAAELGRRPGTVRMMLLRIRTALKQCIERRGISGGEQ
jgi:RNA polymerase sigma factor (sigma-70 family)